jgi:hypothetical protein
MSLLAFLGLRYPVKLLPVLLFESVCKLLWLGLMGLPNIVHGSLDPATSEIAVNSSLVILILAVIPWRYVWHIYVRAPGDRWRWGAPVGSADALHPNDGAGADDGAHPGHGVQHAVAAAAQGQDGRREGGCDGGG